MTGQTPGIVCCEVGDERFALRGGDVRLVARAEQIVGAPGPGGRLGLLHHGGTAAPVYSLAAVLGLSHQWPRTASHVVLTEGSRGPFGLVVDRAARAGVSERFDVLPLPAVVGSSAERWFAGLLLGADLSCLLLSPDGLEPGAPPKLAARRTQPPRPVAPPAEAEVSTIIASFTSAALPPCAGDRYAISARRLAAVVQTLPRISLPGAAACVSALSWWQGAAVPILDFSASDRPASGARHLVVRTRAGAHVGLPVGPEIALRRAAREHVRVGAGESAFVTGIFAIGLERIALVDVDALVASSLAAASAVPAACAS